jgi:hypothetical protein
MNRRVFLQAATAGAALGLTAQVVGAEPAANDKIVVAVMGTGGRGTGLAQVFAKQPGVEVAYVCDADRGRMERAASKVAEVNGGKAPKTVPDFRRILEDKSVDALVIATCNHWHAPAARRCARYTSASEAVQPQPHEGELMVRRRGSTSGVRWAAARTWPKIIEDRRFGPRRRDRSAYGSVLVRNRSDRQKGRTDPRGAGLRPVAGAAPAAVPLNYLHYTGTGSGTGATASWATTVSTDRPVPLGLGVNCRCVTSAGSRCAFGDDQETPDTHIVSFEFDGASPSPGG